MDNLATTLFIVWAKKLKIYIKNNFANNFILTSEFLNIVPILFNQKLDKSLQLYMTYQEQISPTNN